MRALKARKLDHNSFEHTLVSSLVSNCVTCEICASYAEDRISSSKDNEHTSEEGSKRSTEPTILVHHVIQCMTKVATTPTFESSTYKSPVFAALTFSHTRGNSVLRTKISTFKLALEASLLTYLKFAFQRPLTPLRMSPSHQSRICDTLPGRRSTPRYIDAFDIEEEHRTATVSPSYDPFKKSNSKRPKTTGASRETSKGNGSETTGSTSSVSALARDHSSSGSHKSSTSGHGMYADQHHQAGTKSTKG